MCYGSTNVTDTAHLLVYVRGVDIVFTITEKLVRVRSLYGITKDSKLIKIMLQGRK